MTKQAALLSVYLRVLRTPEGVLQSLEHTLRRAATMQPMYKNGITDSASIWRQVTQWPKVLHEELRKYDEQR
jgi:hypothetical protein